MSHKSRIRDFTETHNGILQRRSDLFNEAETIATRLAVIKNEIKAFDKSLIALGYEGDLDAIMPRQRKEAIFGKGELTKAIISELRYAVNPMTSRQIAENILASDGQDIRDRPAMTDISRRISRALRIMRKKGVVLGNGDKDGRNIQWILRPRSG